MESESTDDDEEPGDPQTMSSKMKESNRVAHWLEQSLTLEDSSGEIDEDLSKSVRLVELEEKTKDDLKNDAGDDVIYGLEKVDELVGANECDVIYGTRERVKDDLKQRDSDDVICEREKLVEPEGPTANDVICGTRSDGVDAVGIPAPSTFYGGSIRSEATIAPEVIRSKVRREAAKRNKEQNKLKKVKGEANAARRSRNENKNVIKEHEGWEDFE